MGNVEGSTLIEANEIVVIELASEAFPVIKLVIDGAIVDQLPLHALPFIRSIIVTSALVTVVLHSLINVAIFNSSLIAESVGEVVQRLTR